MRILYGVNLLVWAGLLSACLSQPKPADWLAVGFRTPEETFRTFQTGLRADQPDLEYRCLSSRLKSEQVGSQLVYRTFRQELFKTHPWIRYAAWAKVVESKELSRSRRRLVARIDTWFFDETFAIDFEREDYYELWSGGQLLWDDFHPWEGSVTLEKALQSPEAELVVRVPFEDGLEPADVTEIGAGSQWKITAFPALDTL